MKTGERERESTLYRQTTFSCALPFVYHFVHLRIYGCTRTGAQLPLYPEELPWTRKRTTVQTEQRETGPYPPSLMEEKRNLVEESSLGKQTRGREEIDRKLLIFLFTWGLAHGPELSWCQLRQNAAGTKFSDDLHGNKDREPGGTPPPSALSQREGGRTGCHGP